MYAKYKYLFSTQGKLKHKIAVSFIYESNIKYSDAQAKSW